MADQTEAAAHWDAAYDQGDGTRSWLEKHPDMSLRMLDSAGGGQADEDRRERTGDRGPEAGRQDDQLCRRATERPLVPHQVRFWHMGDSRWWKDFDAALAAALPAGSRILDVGCGDGGLVNRLGELGFDALGLDPAAPAHPRLIREPVEQVTGAGAFDAVTTVMALHHAELDVMVSALTKLLRLHGRLFVYDFDWDAYDGRAANWLARHDPSDADNSVAGWRREHGGLHTGATIKGALDARFVSLLEVRRPYLARMLARHDLEAAEHALIDTQTLPALGFWMIAERER